MNKDFQLSINNGPLFKADTFGREFTFAYYKELYKNQSVRLFFKRKMIYSSLIAQKHGIIYRIKAKKTSSLIVAYCLQDLKYCFDCTNLIIHQNLNPVRCKLIYTKKDIIEVCFQFFDNPYDWVTEGF